MPGGWGWCSGGVAREEGEWAKWAVMDRLVISDEGKLVEGHTKIQQLTKAGRKVQRGVSGRCDKMHRLTILLQKRNSLSRRWSLAVNLPGSRGGLRKL